MFRSKFFHTFEFNVSIITAFFIALAAILLGILPAVAVHKAGTAAAETFGLYADPHAPIPAARPPDPIAHGIPVALNQGGLR